MKQITIYDLLPLLRKGYVSMDENGLWRWCEDEPTPDDHFWDFGDTIDLISHCCLSDVFNIAPFDGDWKDSLMECGGAKTKSDTDLTTDKLRQMMRDPRYWRDHDLECVRKIENGFKKLYGND